MRVELSPSDPRWPDLYEREANRIREILGDRVRVLEHAGSTSVPGLAAKPVIDLVLGVPDSTDESSYVPDLEAAGYTFRLREPDWHEHRLLGGPDTIINLHVFSADSEEIENMIRFRDRLRSDPVARRRYERAKRELASRDWATVQDYADAKTDIVVAIRDS